MLSAVGAALVLVVVIVSPAVQAASGTPPHDLTLPVVTGTPIVGQTLTTSNGTWSGTTPMTFAYRWLRCPPGKTCGAIIGATAQTYKTVSADLGSKIESSVTARNLYGSATATSVPTAPISGGQIQTGASLATCSTNPCKSGAIPNGNGQNGCTRGTFATDIVALGNVSNGVKNECRLYGWYKPANLSGSAAAVLVAPGNNGKCGGDDVNEVFTNSRWQKIADANRVVLILLAKPSYPTCRAGWFSPNIDVPTPATPAASDEPYVRTVVSDAIARLGLDSQRIYLTGVSTGGNLVYDAACDPVTSPKIRGFAAISELMQAKYNGSSFVSGTERCGVPGGSATTNTSFFIENIHGTDDGSVAFGGHCVPQENHCIVSFSENAHFWAGHMHCGSTPTVTMFGTPQALNEQDAYPNCAFGSPPVTYQSVKVVHGCHAWQGLDAQPAGPSTCNGNPSTNNTNGFYTAQSTWNFFSTRAWLG